MTKEKATIWINVTTSAHWNRSAVGVVRVELKLKEELKKLYSTNQVKQCIWRNGVFIEYIPTVQVEKAAENKNKDKSTKEPALIYPILSRIAALESIAIGLLSIVPAKLRPFTSRSLFYLKRKLNALRAKRLHTNRPPIRERLTVPAKKTEQSIFKAQDILLSVGLDWDYAYGEEFHRLKNKQIKIVSCCYDLIPILYPQYCISDVVARFSKYFIDLAENSELILCISKQSEKDLKQLIHNTGAANVKTQVFPLGDTVPLINNEQSSNEIKQLLAEPFILYVSTIERRKNHQILYQAYHLLCKQGKKQKLPKLVFVGMTGWGVDELLKDIELDPLTQGLIIQLNHINDTELRSLYDAALCCVYPSLYEGWGLPVGEALALGKLTLSSNRGSLPEVGQNLVTYIEPWNADEWAKQIEKVIDNDKYRDEMIAAIKQNYTPTDWKQTAEAVKLALDKIINAPYSPQKFYAGYDLTTEIGVYNGAQIESQAEAGLLITGLKTTIPAGTYQLTITDNPNYRKDGSYQLSIKAEGAITKKLKSQIPSKTNNGTLLTEEFKIEQNSKELTLELYLNSGALSIEMLEINEIKKTSQ